MAKKLQLFTLSDLQMLGEALRLLEEQYKTLYKDPGERACLAMSLVDVEYLRRKLRYTATNLKVTTDQRNSILSAER